MKYINSQFALFSLLNYCFKDSYNFSRPWISKNQDISLSNDGIIYDFIDSKDIITYEDLTSYATKMNTHLRYSFLSYAEEVSDDFVQIDERTLIRKHKLQITVQQLNELKETVDLILINAGSIDTATFTGYQLLPHMKYQWNQFLLASIIRSYFPDEYIIGHTSPGGTHLQTYEFLIRKAVESDDKRN